MLGNGDVTCAFEPDGGMSTNNFSRLVPGIYRAGRRRPLPDCGLFCFGRLTSVWAIDGRDVTNGTWSQTLDTRRAVLENRRASQDIQERLTAFVPMGRACVMLRKTVRNEGATPKRVRFGIGYELPDDPYVIGRWTEGAAGMRTYAARWIGHRPATGRVTVLPFEGSLVAETTLAPGECATRTWAVVLEDSLDPNTGSVVDVRKSGWENLLAAHIKDWSDYYAKSWIRVPDSSVQRLLDTARYTVRCSVTAWSYPPGLFPGHWQARYFGFDETYVHGALLAMNAFDLAQRCPDFRHRLLPIAESRVGDADGLFGARWTWETLEDGLVEGAPQGPWTDHVFHMGTIARTAWLQYLYSDDRAYLEAAGYPVLRGCARFFARNMVYADGKGGAFIGKCTDFERLGPAAEKALMTTVGAVYALRRAADAAETLGLADDETAGWRATADALLRGLPVRDGHYVACLNQPDVPNIGLVGGFYPFPVFRASDRLARASADYFFANASSVGSMYPSGTGVCSWYAAKMALTLLALGEREAPTDWLAAAAQQSIGPFGETYEMREPARDHQTAPWFTTAAGACIEAAMRLFVFDEDGVTHLLRGVPASWREASVCTSAVGGFRVRLDLKDGRLARLDVEARNPAPGKCIRLRGRKGLFADLDLTGATAKLVPGRETDDLVVYAQTPGACLFVAPAVRPAVTAGDNLVLDGSFELGGAAVSLSRTIPVQSSGTKFPFVPQEVVSGNAAFGVKALRVRDPHHTGGVLWFNEMRLEPGREYTLSFSTRADAPGCTAVFTVRAWDFKDEAARQTFKAPRIHETHAISVTPGSAWRRHARLFRVPSTWRERVYGMSARIRFPTNAPPEAAVWLDGLQLVEGDSGAYVRTDRLEAAVVPKRNRVVRRNGEAVPVDLSVRLHNTTARPASGSYWLVGRDTDLGIERFRAEKRYALAPDEVSVRAVSVPCSFFGALRFDVEFPADIASRTVGGHVCVLGACDRRARDPERSFSLGLNTASLGLTGPGWMGVPEPGAACVDGGPYARLEAYRDIGLRVLRIMGGEDPFHWRVVERTPGAFDFSHVDYAVEACRRLDLQALPCLAGGDFGQRDGWPAWVTNRCQVLERQGWSGRAQTYLPPVAEWTNFVQRLVAHCAGRVRHWEFCNEPNDRFRPYSLYVDWLKLTDAAIKAANPAARTVGFCSTGDLGNDPEAFLADCFRRGGLAWCDVVSFHPYNAQMLATPSQPTRVRADDQLKAVRRHMASAGVVRPLWDTECFYLSAREGNYTNREIHEPHHVAWRALTDLACGVKLSCFLADDQVWRDPLAPAAVFWPIFRARTLNGDAVALNMVARTLQDAVPVALRELGKNSVLCLFRTEDGASVAAAWHYGLREGDLGPTHRGLEVSVPPAVRVTDMYGNDLPSASRQSLDARPRYFFGTADDLNRIALLPTQTTQEIK